MTFYKEGLNPLWRVSALTFEQKIAGASQIKNHCFQNQLIQAAWKSIWKLEKLGWIERVPAQRQFARTTKYFSATNKGLKEYMMINDLNEFKLQLKSNNPEHDLTLTDIRFQLSRSPRCLLYFSENVIMSKLYEDEIAEMCTFRSHRSDAAVLIGSLEAGALWVAIEYERPGKSIDRLKEKLRSYYQNEQIRGVFYICQGQSFVQKMKDIEAKIYPHIKRKMYFAELNEFLSAKDEVKFVSSDNGVVSMKLNEKPRVIMPIIERELVLSIANQCKK